MLVAAGTLPATVGTIGVSLRFAGLLNGDLALEDGLSVEFGDGALGLSWSGEIYKSIPYRAGSTRVGGNGDSLTVARGQKLHSRKDHKGWAYTRKSLKKVFSSPSVVA